MLHTAREKFKETTQVSVFQACLMTGVEAMSVINVQGGGGCSPELPPNASDVYPKVEVSALSP